MSPSASVALAQAEEILARVYEARDAMEEAAERPAELTHVCIMFYAPPPDTADVGPAVARLVADGGVLYLHARGAIEIPSTRCWVGAIGDLYTSILVSAFPAAS